MPDKRYTNEFWGVSKKSTSKFFGVQNSNAAFHLPIPPDVGVSIVKASTAILPQVDSVGHFVLKTNEMLINKLKQF